MAIKRAASRSRPLSASERASLANARQSSRNRTARRRNEADASMRTKPSKSKGGNSPAA
jgi:hypothetical protein